MELQDSFLNHHNLFFPAFIYPAGSSIPDPWQKKCRPAEDPAPPPFRDTAAPITVLFSPQGCAVIIPLVKILPFRKRCTGSVQNLPGITFTVKTPSSRAYSITIRPALGDQGEILTVQFLSAPPSPCRPTARTWRCRRRRPSRRCSRQRRARSCRSPSSRRRHPPGRSRCRPSPQSSRRSRS